MGSLTPEQISTAMTVILTVLGGIITVDKAVDIIKKWRAPSTDTERKLANDKRRIDALEDDSSKTKDCLELLMNGVCALLDHELHNGNAAQMQKSRDEIDKYLQGLIKK